MSMKSLANAALFAAAVCLMSATSTHGFGMSGAFAPCRPMGLRAASRSLGGGVGVRVGAVSVKMGNGFDGEVTVTIKRNFGDKFFLEGNYVTEDGASGKVWTFQRTWKDFVKLDKVVKSEPELSAGVPPVPPEPYILGEEASNEPFKDYLDAVMAIPGALTAPLIYDFLKVPNVVLVNALPDYEPIDVDVVEGGTVYDGETDKYSVPVLDPIMLAAKAGKQYKSVADALEEAEVSKNAGKSAAELKVEAQKAAAVAAEKVGEAVKGKSKSSGKALGGMIGNLRAGKGIFGEKNTMAFSRTVAKKAGLEIPAYTDTDKWTLTVAGPAGEPVEVTVRPTQKAGLLLKAWKAENDVDGEYVIEGGVDSDVEIGKVGKDGGIVKVIALIKNK
eukprot:CAMPEP_0173470350 /NCGR_PEP_ID=MMETSP1357-20121228/77834_1 /TAXON_ID=77926 /ORGANISM="Hemiselmis rufescens, Strain PCC563" /LENGTH=387 /DNA_ID=CAMNT_0014438623 /DNA_START=13 /DNA_END=1176 /DNA_ORIENTATION=+